MTVCAMPGIPHITAGDDLGALITQAAGEDTAVPAPRGRLEPARAAIRSRSPDDRRRAQSARPAAPCR
jgi:hypothetical protein